MNREGQLRPGRWLLASAAAAIVGLSATVSSAQVPVCVEVVAPEAELAGLKKLVRSELDRHPSHHMSDGDCHSHLRVEVFEAGGARYLTAQVDREVPARYVVHDAAELGARLSDAIALVLHNDPAYLTEDISHYSDVQRFGHSVLQAGLFTFRMEMFQALSRADTGAAFASGGALGMTRGSGHWQVLGRLYFAGSLLPASGTTRVLEIMTGADGGLTYEFRDKAFWTPYVSACLGVSFLRFAAREPAGPPADAQHVGAAASVRAGLRLFRWTRFDVDAFAQGYLPLFTTADEDGTLFAKPVYTPTVQLGIGVGF